MATKHADKQFPKTVQERWWWTYSDRLRRCHQCSEALVPGTVYAFLPLTHSALCEECFKDTGQTAKQSERLRVLRGGAPWTPSRPEQRLLTALAERPMTVHDLARAVNMHPGKVRGLLGHLKARKRVEQDDDHWKQS